MFVCMSRFYVNRLGPFVDFLSNENNLDVSVLSTDERRIFKPDVFEIVYGATR